MSPLMLDNDCWAMEIIWRNLETDKRISKQSENSCNSNGGGCVPVKIYFAFLIHVAKEIQLSSIFFL